MRKLIYTFLSPLSYFLNKRNKNLRVLAYHTVPSAKIFSKQLTYLKDIYHIISIKELEDYFLRHKDLPENSLLITFDDGDITVLENGLPVLEKYSLPAVLFVITDLLDTEHTFWCRWVEKDFDNRGRSYAEARKKVNYLKSIPEKERKEYLESLAEVKSRQLTSTDLQKLKKKNIFIANHTHTHPMVNMCTAEELKEELEKAKKKFKIWDMEGYEIFAYPNGNWEPKSEKILMEEGIKMAFLFDHRLNKDISKINPMRISRIMVNADDDLAEFKVKVSGLHSKLLTLKNKFLKN